MHTFAVKEKDFYLDNQPFKILSGAIHYFRIHPTDWRHSLHNLKALGFNTVETYLPWNLHEKNENVFLFEDNLDVVKFVQTAQEEGLFVILRPSPYICAEWELGGLPAWLLQKDCRVRSSDPNYLKYVNRYYEHLFKLLVPLQITHGGPVLMMQVENEYGSYGEDKDYLRALAQMMQDKGVEVPLFTSDGAWHATLEAGSLVTDGILETGNFGSKATENFENILAFQKQKGVSQPLMCMEFWDGWFNRWGEPIVTRDQDEMVEALEEVVKQASVNLYMFHGGTNFGFMNGCSARGTHDLHQITSYDYGAPLDEQGNPTEGYYKIQAMLKRLFPEIKQTKPWVKESMQVSDISLVDKVSLFEVVEQIADKQTFKYPVSMDEAGQFYGYMLYQTTTKRDIVEEKYRIIDGRDRAQFFLNEELQATQYQEEIGEEILTKQPYEQNEVAILMENMGRVNYGAKLLADTQEKGIRTGVMSDIHFILDWNQYALDFSRIGAIDFNKAWKEGVPGFYKYNFELTEVLDSNLDLSGFGKGVVFVNGFNVGRFWNKGPIKSLYIPHGLFKLGENEIIIFETEGIYQDKINLVRHKVIEQL